MNTTMTTPTHTESIQVSSDMTVEMAAADVFAYVADLRNSSDWNRAISSTRPLTSRTIGIGAQFEQSRTVPHHATEVVEVTEYQPNRILEVTVTTPEQPVRYRYEFSSAGDSRCRVRLTVSLRPDHPVMRPDFYRARLTRVLASSLNGLRAALVRHYE
ncbi:MAG: SRPBCC family protein [Acidimicrobiia bacterium]